MGASYSVESVESRQLTVLKRMLLPVVSVLLATACVDPFEHDTTTPAKLQRSERGAASMSRTPSPANDQAKLSRSKSSTQPSSNQSASSHQPRAKKEAEKKQSYEQAWQLICHAETLSGAPRDATREARGAMVAGWIVNHITNTKARYWFIDFGNAKQPDKPALFMAEVKRVGFKECPLAELLFQPMSPASLPDDHRQPSERQPRP